MAYKQKGCAPITAKLQKTTKSGINQQSLLNMSSPLKQSGYDPFKVSREAQKKQKAAENKASYEKKLEGYKKTTLALESGKLKGRDKVIASRKASQFSGELFSYDKKNNPSSVEGYKTAGDYAKSKINKVNKPKDDTPKDDTPKVDTPKVDTPKVDTPKANKPKREIQKSVSNIAPKKTVEIKAPNLLGEINITKTVPKKETNTRKEIRSAREAFRAGDITKKQKKAIIGEEKAMQKNARANKRAGRIAKRATKRITNI